MRVGKFLSRPLSGEWPYFWLVATYLKVRQRVPPPVNAASLPGRFEHSDDGGLGCAITGGEYAAFSSDTTSTPGRYDLVDPIEDIVPRKTPTPASRPSNCSTVAGR